MRCLVRPSLFPTYPLELLLILSSPIQVHLWSDYARLRWMGIQRSLLYSIRRQRSWMVQAVSPHSMFSSDFDRRWRILSLLADSGLVDLKESTFLQRLPSKLKQPRSRLLYRNQSILLYSSYLQPNRIWSNRIFSLPNHQFTLIEFPLFQALYPTYNPFPLSRLFVPFPSPLDVFYIALT